jgi:hypothetical protein
MDQVTHFLDPLIELLPPELQEYWPLLIFVPALLILLPIAWYQRRALKALIVRPFRPIKPQPKLDEDLSSYPAPSFGPARRRLMIEGVPARIRLVVLAPAGTGERIDENGLKDMLNRVLWGLGAIVEQDQPQIRIWPPQLSSHGFPAVFHRLAHTKEGDAEPSRWILLGGATPPRPRTVLLGLGLWTDEPTTIGRLSMEPRDWALSLHVQNLEPDASLAVNALPDQVAPAAPEGPQGEDATPLPSVPEPARAEEPPVQHASESSNNQEPAATPDSPAAPQEPEPAHAVHTAEAAPNEAPSHPHPENNQHP